MLGYTHLNKFTCLYERTSRLNRYLHLKIIQDDLFFTLQSLRSCGLGCAYVILYVTKHVLRMRIDVDVRPPPRGRRQIGRFNDVLLQCR